MFNKSSLKVDTKLSSAPTDGGVSCTANLIKLVINLYLKKDDSIKLIQFKLKFDSIQQVALRLELTVCFLESLELVAGWRFSTKQI